MKKFFIALTFAAAFICSTAMAQQPNQRPDEKDQPRKEKMDQPRHDHAHQNCPHHGEKGQTECKHEGQQGQHHCNHEGQPGHQCNHEGGCQHDTFRPHGQPIVTFFEHFGATYSSDEWHQNGFQMERAYLGYKYMFNPHWTTTIILDAAEASFSNPIEHVFVKNAFVQYKNHGLTVAAGIIPTTNGILSEKIWGLRYVGRSMFDLYGYGYVADLGFNVKYDFCHWFSADFSMLNGEGFRNIQFDDHYSYALGLDFRPLEGLTLRVFGDIHPYDALTAAYADTVVSRKDLLMSVGYENRHFRIGADYNMIFQDKNTHCDGFSVYAIGKVNPKLDLFCRYDNGTLMSNTLTYVATDDLQNIIVGADYHINKMVSVAPAVQYTITNTPATAAAPATAANALYAYLSCKVNL